MDNWTEVAVHAALTNYDLLVERARHVADIVYHVRYPRDLATHFDIAFYDAPYQGYEAHYHYRSNDHSIHVPIAYLWETDDDLIRQREEERIEAERAIADLRRKAQEAAEKAEQEAIERKTYERLRKKFEGS